MLGSPIQNGHGANLSSSSSNANVSKDEVGWLFVQEYYTILNKEPARLHLFYTKKSTLVHGNEGESVRPCIGQIEIHKKIMGQNYRDCKVLVSNVDSQPSFSGGIVIQVLGEIANDNGPSQKFAQTFFLAEQQPSGYFVLNDIFRYLKEDDGSEYEPEDIPNLDENQLQAPEQAQADVTKGNVATMEEKYVPATPYGDANGITFNPSEDIESQPDEHTREVSLEEQNTIPQHSEGGDMATSSATSQSQGAENPESTESADQASPTSPQGDEATNRAPPKPFSWANMAGSSSGPSNRGRTSNNRGAKAQATPNPSKGEPSVPKAAAPILSAAPAAPAASSAIAADKVNTSIFIKNVGPKVSEESLGELLGTFGKFGNLDINRPKNCAFADFHDVEGFKLALEAGTVRLGADNIIIDERRRGYGRGQDRKGYNQNVRRQQNKDGGREEGGRGRGRGVSSRVGGGPEGKGPK